MSGVQSVPQSRRDDLRAAAALTSFLLTGAFVLQSLGIPPLLDVVYNLVFSDSTPVFVSIALGASGIFHVAYQLLFATVLAPLECTFGVDVPVKGEVELSRIEVSDFLVLILTFAVYEWALVVRGVEMTAGSMVGGMLFIVATLVFRVVPRWVARQMNSEECFFALKTTLLSVILTTVALIPVMFVVSTLT